MRNLLTIWGLTALLLVVAQARADDKDKPVKDKASDSLKLEGDYTIVSGEKFGQKEPEERIKGTMVHITADKISVTDKDKKETFVASYTVDTDHQAAPRDDDRVGTQKRRGGEGFSSRRKETPCV